MIELKDRRVLVMGLGLFDGGVGLTRYLVSKGAKVTITDLRRAEELIQSLNKLSGLPIEYHLENHLEEDFRSSELIIVNPSVPPSSPFLQIAREADVPLSSEMRLFSGLFRDSVLAVTGSNGKTTTASLLGEIVRAHDHRSLVGGNMGVCLLNQVDESVSDQPAVLELSSFQLEDLTESHWSPHIAVVTNLTPNHLDRHGTFSAYIEAKAQILRDQTSRDTAVLNAEDPQIVKLAGLTKARLLWFGVEEADGVNFFQRGSELIARFGGAEQSFFDLDNYQLRGDHNVANALAAAAAAYGYGIPLRIVAEQLARFQAIPHRLEPVGTVNGVTWYNDSISTTPESAIAALRSFEEPLWLIAGGYDKGANFHELGREIALLARGCILIGKTAGAIRQAVEMEKDELVADGFRPALQLIEEVGTLDAAVERAAETAEFDDVVILSPACASYDQYANFAQRGEVFRKLVKRLSAPDSSTES
ncbi:UDP-N-acetylmuramoyl-L-alanine--D-glutamate ligase [bacterium]|nr:UDP-N-acetylmuramoyl-L-alanine--D-glutamate ligase [bacterium]